MPIAGRVVQILVEGDACVALTADGKVYTWAVREAAHGLGYHSRAGSVESVHASPASRLASATGRPVRLSTAPSSPMAAALGLPPPTSAERAGSGAALAADAAVPPASASGASGAEGAKARWARGGKAPARVPAAAAHHLTPTHANSGAGTSHPPGGAPDSLALPPTQLGRLAAAAVRGVAEHGPSPRAAPIAVIEWWRSRDQQAAAAAQPAAAPPTRGRRASAETAPSRSVGSPFAALRRRSQTLHEPPPAGRGSGVEAPLDALGFAGANHQARLGAADAAPAVPSEQDSDEVSAADTGDADVAAQAAREWHQRQMH